MAFLADPLSITWILLVTGVGMLIHLYAIGYMHGDPGFGRFFAYFNLFAASMLILVLGNNYLVTFLGWEGVGVCSYLLISFWNQRESAALGGKKAFIYNRVGDFGFMLAMFLLIAEFGTLDYGATSQAASTAAGGVVTAVALLLFLAVTGKSAQIPLFPWLTDAMEGPTPVSALIHAATMVTAGIFLVARTHPFFDASQDASTVVAWVGALTALLAGTIACLQPDIKRALAYSTISQLGYMVLALGLRRVHRRGLPGAHARVLQGLPVPRCRVGDPRQRREPGHAGHGALQGVPPGHRDGDGHRLARDHRRPAVRRLLVEGPRSSSRRSRPATTASGCSRRSPP